MMAAGGNKLFLGLDLETSGTEIRDGAVPIQLGMAYRIGKDELATFGQHIGGWEWENLSRSTYKATSVFPGRWSKQAAEVHGLTPKSLLNMNDIRMVDYDAEQWLIRSQTDVFDTPFKRPNVHIVGWNVAGFDYPFVKEYMPRLSGQLSYRTVDLNALVFSLVGATYFGETLYYNMTKKMAKEYATEQMEAQYGFDRHLHDAESDAIAALFEYDWLKHLIRSCNA